MHIELVSTGWECLNLWGQEFPLARERSESALLRAGRSTLGDKAGADRTSRVLDIAVPRSPRFVRLLFMSVTQEKPFNFMVGIKGKSFSVADLAAAGVRRISLATSLYRAAMTGFLDAAREVAELGEFGFLNRCVVTAELNELMRI
jgi:2-methylisocitrate lyase-like PEP mutase family enzyme